MALENLISVEFTDEEMQQVDGHLTALQGLLEGKCITLTPKQRKEYGRLGNRTENWVKKVIDYTGSQPALSPPFLDKVEMDKDYAARQALLPRMAKLKTVNNMLDDTLLLIGYDLYNSARAYYKNVKMLAEQNIAGAKAVFDDLSNQFAGHGSKPNAEG